MPATVPVPVLMTLPVPVGVTGKRKPGVVLFVTEACVNVPVVTVWLAFQSDDVVTFDPHFSEKSNVLAVPSPPPIKSRPILVNRVSNITPLPLFTTSCRPLFATYARVAEDVESGGVEGQTNKSMYGAVAIVPVAVAVAALKMSRRSRLGSNGTGHE